MTQYVQHTPGPWSINRSVDKRSGWHVRGGEKLKDAAKAPSICRLSVNGHPDDVQANAHLLAAAPELLEALEEALIMAEAGLEFRSEKARHLIAKAKGVACREE
jgi:hypothetical protein